MSDIFVPDVVPGSCKLLRKMELVQMLCMYMHIGYDASLVGGLEHQFYFPIYWE